MPVSFDFCNTLYDAKMLVYIGSNYQLECIARHVRGCSEFSTDMISSFYPQLGQTSSTMCLSMEAQDICEGAGQRKQ